MVVVMVAVVLVAMHENKVDQQQNKMKHREGQMPLASKETKNLTNK